MFWCFVYIVKHNLNWKHHYKYIMENKKHNDPLTSMETTRSMRQKAKLLGRCLITMLKCFRSCKKTPNDTKNAKRNILWFFNPLKFSTFPCFSFLATHEFLLFFWPKNTRFFHGFAMWDIYLSLSWKLSSYFLHKIEPTSSHWYTLHFCLFKLMQRKLFKAELHNEFWRTIWGVTVLWEFWETIWGVTVFWEFSTSSSCWVCWILVVSEPWYQPPVNSSGRPLANICRRTQATVLWWLLNLQWWTNLSCWTTAHGSPSIKNRWSIGREELLEFPLLRP